MKRLLPGLCCALLLSAFGPVPSASAGWWPWHRHSKSGSASNPAPAPKPSKSKTPKSEKPHKEKKAKHHHGKAAKVDNTAGVVTTPGPRSVGWWHKQPGPAGAGAN